MYSEAKTVGYCKSYWLYILFHSAVRYLKHLAGDLNVAMYSECLIRLVRVDTNSSLHEKECVYVCSLWEVGIV